MTDTPKGATAEEIALGIASTIRGELEGEATLHAVKCVAAKIAPLLAPLVAERDAAVAGRSGWVATEWIPVEFDNVEAGHAPVPTISLQRSPCYDGPRYAVRQGSRTCLDREDGWVAEPMPSSRDDEFYESCRFRSFAEAEEALQRVGGDRFAHYRAPSNA